MAARVGVNAFDLALLALLAVFAVLGVWRGLVHEMVSLVTWVVACVGAWTFSDSVATLFERVTRESEIRHLLAFVTIFIAVFIVGMVSGVVLNKFVNRSAGLRMANRTVGGALGLVRGAVIVVVLFLLAGLTSFPQRPWWREAALTPAFERAAAYAARYLPRDVARHLPYG